MNTSKIKALAQSTRQGLQRYGHRAGQVWIGLNCSLIATLANAQAAPKLDFKGTESMLTDFVKFIAGPFGKAAVIISIVAAFVTWVFAPKEGIFGPVLRVVVAGVAIMNAAIWVTSLGAGGGNISLS
jgi:type IV secretory pathway VirB2 component (pilin)